MSNDDLLISQLISETYDDTTEKDQPNAVVDLRHYFEKKLNEVEFFSIEEYLVQHHLQVVDLAFQNNTQCYRLVYSGSTLDFPNNWSIFKEISSENVVFLDQSLDQDFLLDIFAEVTGEIYNLALIKEEQDVKMIFLIETDSKEHVQWFRGYFEKKKAQSEKDAA